MINVGSGFILMWEIEALRGLGSGFHKLESHMVLSSIGP